MLLEMRIIQFLFAPSAIIRKYQGRRINSVQVTSFQSEDMRIVYKMEILCKEMRGRTITTQELCIELAKMSSVIFNGSADSPHAVIQSDYIVLWANVDIHFAMNYILSAYCTAFDEVAVVTLMKQLTVCSDRYGDYAGIIKAIWNELFHHPTIMNAVLHDITRNVASYSLRSLAVYDHNTSTMMRLLDESMKAKQQITLATYECVISRLGKIPIHKRPLTGKDINTIYRIWVESTVSLKYVHPKTRQAWKDFMLQTCWDLKLPSLTQKIKAFYNYNCTIGRTRKQRKRRDK